MEWLMSLTTEEMVNSELVKIEARLKKAKTLGTRTRVGNIRASLNIRLKEIKEGIKWEKQSFKSEQ